MSLNLGIIASSRSSAPSVQLLLDTYPGTAAAYSLRKLRTAYTGAAIRVRRDSDNTETDIGFNGGGGLDTTALTTFVGAGNGFVTKWYDQTSNARDAVQSTTSNQPTIVLSGSIYTINSKPAALFNGTTTELVTSTIASWLTATPYTFILVDRVNTIKSDNFFCGTAGTSTGTDRTIFAGYRNASQVSLAQYADDANFSFTQVQQQKLHNIYFKFPTSEYFINNTSLGTQTNPANGANITDGGFQIGRAYGVGGYRYNGYLQEVIAYPSNQLSNRTGMNSNINSFYSIYWQGTGNALLDLYPSAAAAYSLRNLSSTYLGPLIRVRRSSDSTEMDIYGTYAGVLDTASLLAFCGTGDGFIRTWYDQSGNARNLNQTNTPLQPSIVISGVLQIVNTRPTIYIDGISQNLVATISLSSTTYFFDVLKTADTTFTLYHSGDSSAFILQVGTQSSTNTGINYNTVVNSTYKNNVLQTAPTTRGDVYNLISTNTQILLSYNTSLTLWSQINLSGYSGFQFNVYQQEIIIYNNNQAANLSGINSNINSFYTIY